MNEQEIKTEISEIENRIREVSSNVRFGNPMFSEWYEEQVDRIRELKEMLKT